MSILSSPPPIVWTSLWGTRENCIIYEFIALPLPSSQSGRSMTSGKRVPSQRQIHLERGRGTLEIDKAVKTEESKERRVDNDEKEEEEEDEDKDEEKKKQEFSSRSFQKN